MAHSARRLARHRARSPHRPRRFRMMGLEPLEPRRLLAAVPVVQGLEALGHTPTAALDTEASVTCDRAVDPGSVSEQTFAADSIQAVPRIGPVSQSDLLGAGLGPDTAAGAAAADDDSPGPYVLRHTPSGTVPAPTHEVYVTFNEPINEETFDCGDVVVVADRLFLYIPVRDVSPVVRNTYRITFENPGLAVDYHVEIGPHIEDLDGNEMDQDRDGRLGEPDDDVYDACYVVVDTELPKVGDLWPAPGTSEVLVSSVVAQFTRGMVPESVDPRSFMVVSDPGGDLLFGTEDDVLVEGEVSYDPGTWKATFTPFLERLPQGRYAAVITDAVRDMSGTPLDGEWLGEFPSGDGEPGGVFVAMFQVRDRGEIRGAKWHDLDADGARDEAEPALEGWTIYLDQNRNGQLDGGERRTVTDQEGRYAFEDLGPDVYFVAEQLQTGWRQTYPPTGPGPEFRVNDYSSGEQVSPAVARHAGGRFVATWQSASPDADGWDVYARVCAADGTALGEEFRVNETTLGEQTQPAVAMDAAGNFVVTWESSAMVAAERGIYARMYDAEGDPRGGQFLVSAPMAGPQQCPSIAVAPAGPFVIAWTGTAHGGREFDRVFARMYDASGAPLGDEFQVNTFTSAGRECTASVAVATSGHFVVAWSGWDGLLPGMQGVYARLYDAYGSPGGPEFRVDTLLTDVDYTPAAAMDTQGNFAIVWGSDDLTDGPGYADIQARLFYADGRPRTDQFQVNSNLLAASLMPSLDMDPQGNFVVAWTGELWSPRATDAYARMFWQDGTSYGSEFIVNAGRVGRQREPAVAIDHADRFVVIWADTRVLENDDLFGRCFVGFGLEGVHKVTLHFGQVVEDLDFGNCGAGTLRGSKFHDLDADGAWDEGEPGLEDWTVFLDVDDDGQYDPPLPGFTREIDPYGPPGPIEDPLGFVDFEEALGGGRVVAVPPELPGPVPISEKVFGWLDPHGHEHATWSETTSVLAIEFAEPVSTVSLDFLGTGLRGGYQGIMQAFDSSGTLLVERRTDVIWGFESTRLTVSVPSDQISRVEATGASAWIPIMIDRLRFTKQGTPGEPSTQTDEQGNYEFADLVPDTYVVAEILPGGWRQTLPGPEAELLDAVSRRVGEGGALGFEIAEIAAGWQGGMQLEAEITFVVTWSDTTLHLVPDAATYTVVGNEILVDLYGIRDEGPGLPIVWTETQTITVGALQSGDYTIAATLHEAPNPILPAFWPTWEAEGKMALRDTGRYRVTIEDGETIDHLDFGNLPWARVVQRHVFYNNSAFDDPLHGRTDDDAIAPGPHECPDPRHGKTALLPGQTATFRNYTSYEKGLNGIMVDIVDLQGTFTDGDLEFRMGNDDEPGQWMPAPRPSSITVREGVGAEDSDRVTIIWEDGLIRNAWVQVRVKADGAGLRGDEVFYFGNTPGEAGNSEENALVNLADEMLVRANFRSPRHPAPICSPYDYSRDQVVDVTDRIIARNNRTGVGNSLRLISVPGDTHGGALDPAAARDAVLERAGRQPAGGDRTAVGKLAWLADLERFRTRQRRSNGQSAVLRAADALFAADWA